MHVDQRLQNPQIQSVVNFIMNIISNYYPLQALDLLSLLKDLLSILHLTLFWKWPDMNLETCASRRFCLCWITETYVCGEAVIRDMCLSQDKTYTVELCESSVTRLFGQPVVHILNLCIKIWMDAELKAACFCRKFHYCKSFYYSPDPITWPDSWCVVCSMLEK